MGSILQSLSKTIHLSIVLAVLLFIYLFYTDGGWSFYKYLKKKHYPPGYQVLCANCNSIKAEEEKKKK